MNLNDPFGRLLQRDEKEYQALRTALKDEGVSSRARLDAVAARIQRRCLGTMAVTAAIGCLLFVLFPKFGVVAVAIAFVMLLWLAKIMVSGRRHIRRYAREEIEHRGSAGEPV